MSDLNRFRYTMESCNHCGQCKWILPHRMSGWDFAEVCPIHHHFGFDAYSGQGLVNIAREVMEGKLERTDELADMVHTCAACGACDVNCKSVRDMEVLETIYELRHDLAQAGHLPDSCRRMAENVSAGCDPFGVPLAEHFSWLPEDFRDDPDSDTVLFAGCSASRDPGPVLAAIRILKAGGVPFRLLREEERCCGGALWRSGQQETAGDLIRGNAEAFRKAGIRTVITVCGECFGAFRSIYPRFVKPGFRTVHISQVAAGLIREGKLAFRQDARPLTVTYHDPCMLGRLSEEYVPWEGEIRSYGLHVPEKHWNRGEFGVYQEPRDVLSALPGITLREMTRRVEESWCCGYWTGQADPECAAATADERMREARSTDAEAIVSCCPFCRTALSGAGAPLPVVDLAELVAGRLA
ncbi:MAG: (Fe-S)-binding protein [Oscillospiraceae bacterium]|nr:(Fe-S)-binding protein [Oscillospiraceae bacterium]